MYLIMKYLVIKIEDLTKLLVFKDNILALCQEDTIMEDSNKAVEKV